MNDLSFEDKSDLIQLLSDINQVLANVEAQEATKRQSTIDLKSILNASQNLSKYSNVPKYYTHASQCLPNSQKLPFINNQYITSSQLLYQEGARKCATPQVKCVCVDGRFYLRLYSSMPPTLTAEEKESYRIYISTQANMHPDYYFNQEFINHVKEFDDNDPIDYEYMNNNFKSIWCATTCYGYIRSDILQIDFDGWQDKANDQIEMTEKIEKYIDKSKIQNFVVTDEVMVDDNDDKLDFDDFI